MSSNGNGNGKPLAFPPAAIPIVGQPCSIEGWFLQVLLMCKCEAPKPVLLVGQPGTAVGQCASCKRGFVIQGLSVNPQGQMQFQIGLARVEAPDPTVPGVPAKGA